MADVISKEDVLNAFHKDVIIKLHAYDRIKQRELNLEMIENAILEDDIVESYPDDYPLSSILLLGFHDKCPLHIICAPSDKGLIIISAYIPNQDIWQSDYKTRIEKDSS